MRVNFGQRLIPISTLGFGVLLVGVVFAMALYAFGSYVRHLRGDAASLVSEAVATAESLPNADARQAAQRVAARFIQPALLVVFVDRSSRVTVIRTSSGPGATRATIVVRDRNDRRLPEARGVFARPTLGLATAFGLQPLHAHAGQLDITVDENDVRLVEDVRSFAPAFGVALLLSIGIAFTTARLLTRSALRPLDDVTRALERFSAGDFTPEFIESDGNERLGALALAYNGAVEQVERSFEERARANAMMRQFVADGGHQLRTPLTVIRGFVGILRSQGASMEPHELEHIYEAMGTQTLVMSALIDKLILLDQLEDTVGANPRPADVAAIAREIVAPISLAHPNRSLRIEANAPEYASVDASDVRHALSNIVDNALKYTAGDVQIAVTSSNGHVVVSVTDQGPGMQPDHVMRAFDRFFRGERRDVEGSGLGLAIAKRATERSGGSLEIVSTVGRGTQLTLTFRRGQSPDQPE